MHKIGVLSNTHGLLRPEVLEALKDCDVILHGGDINKKKILDELETIAPVYAVRGNNDKEWADYLPENLQLEFFGIKFFIVHNKKMIPSGLQDVDVVIYGHSHKYEEKRMDGTFYLNPGSCGPRRFTQPITLAVIHVKKGDFRVKRIEILHAENRGNKSIDVNKKVIRAVMKETDQGKTVSQIAEKYKLSKGLAEQICRLYLTHPGVDADGILRKMGY